MGDRKRLYFLRKAFGQCREDGILQALTTEDALRRPWHSVEETRRQVEAQEIFDQAYMVDQRNDDSE